MQRGPYPNSSTPAALQGYLERLTGPLYEPRTTAGRYAQTAGEFLPAVLAGVEFGDLKKLADRTRLKPLSPDELEAEADKFIERHRGLYSLEDAVKEFAYEETP